MPKRTTSLNFLNFNHLQLFGKPAVKLKEINHFHKRFA